MTGDLVLVNPYLKAWTDLAGPDVGYGDSWWDSDRRYGKLPPFVVGRELPDIYGARSGLVSRYSWSVPTPESLDAIAAYGPVVDVMAGTGYWARLLRDRGVDVIAFDLYPPAGDAENYWHPEPRAWIEIAENDCETSAADHADRTMLLSWPPYGRSAGWRALKAYTRAGGRTVAYVGEGAYGCCGDDRLHSVLDGRFGLWKEAERVELPQWPGLHDGLTIYERVS